MHFNSNIVHRWADKPFHAWPINWEGSKKPLFKIQSRKLWHPWKDSMNERNWDWKGKIFTWVDRDLNPWPSRWRCSAVTVIVSSQTPNGCNSPIGPCGQKIKWERTWTKCLWIWLFCSPFREGKTGSSKLYRGRELHYQLSNEATTGWKYFHGKTWYQQNAQSVIAQSVRPLHRHRGGHRFESRWSHLHLFNCTASARIISSIHHQTALHISFLSRYLIYLKVMHEQISK